MESKNIKYSGLTTLPDDYQSVDGSLAFATNAVSEDGAIRIIPPAMAKNLVVERGDKVYVHSTASYTHYIVAHQTLAERDEDGGIVSGADEVTLYWVDESKCADGMVYCVTDADRIDNGAEELEGGEVRENGPVFTIGAYAGKFVDLAFVGNTVVLSTSESLYYLLWKADEDGYIYLGESIPKVTMQWGLNLTLGRNVFLDTGITLEQKTGVSAGENWKPIMSCTYDHPHVQSKRYYFTATDSSYTRKNSDGKDVTYLPAGSYRAYQYSTRTHKASPDIKAVVDSTGVDITICDVPERSRDYKYFTLKEDYSDISLSVTQRKSAGTVFIESGTSGVSVNAMHVKDGEDDGQNNFTAVMGYMNKFVNEQGRKSDRFIYPFMLRYAVKLYDGTWCNLSTPILLYPNTGYAPFMRVIQQSKLTDVELYAFTASLHYELRDFLGEEWRDIVQGVGVFVSQPVYPYDQGASWEAGVSSYEYLYNNFEDEYKDGELNPDYVNDLRGEDYGIGMYDGGTTDGSSVGGGSGSDESSSSLTVTKEPGDGMFSDTVNEITAVLKAFGKDGEQVDLTADMVSVTWGDLAVSVTVTQLSEDTGRVGDDGEAISVSYLKLSITRQYEGEAVAGYVNISATVDGEAVSAAVYVSTEGKEVTVPEYDTGDYTVVDCEGPLSLYGYLNQANNNGTANTTVRIARRKRGEIQDDILNIANFYKIGEIDFDDLLQDAFEGETPAVDFEIEEGTLNSLEARETLKEEEVSVNGFQGANLFVYNNRLHVTGGTRSLPAVTATLRQNGKINLPPEFEPTDDNNIRYRGYVLVRTDEGTRMVETDDVSLYLAPWFFYPDTRAYRYIEYAPAKYRAHPLDDSGNEIEDEEYDCLVYDLKPHDFLNGSYLLRDAGRFCRAVLDPDNDDVDLTSDFEDEVTVDTGDKVGNLNKIYVSDASNPFVFKNAMVCAAGSGQVLALSSAAKALSQGQFGQFPLYAFTDEGIWAMSVGSTGAYETVQPIARDVATNVAAITQLDSCVVFVTARGVMLVEGSNVVCMSDAIDGDFGQFDPRDLEGFHALMRRYLGFGAGDIDSTVGKWASQSFFDFIKGCKMRYDYIHQRITVYSDDCDMAYVYSLKSKEWLTQLTDLQDNVNSYPDAYALREADSITFVDADGETVGVETSELVNLSEYDLEAERGPMLFVTRPLKLDAADIYKTVTDVAQRGYFRQDAKENHVIGTVLYGSPDLFHWFMVAQSGGLDSHRIENVHGTPYKYFRLVVVSRLDVREGISGCSVWFETKDTQRMR